MEFTRFAKPFDKMGSVATAAFDEIGNFQCYSYASQDLAGVPMKYNGDIAMATSSAMGFTLRVFLSLVLLAIPLPRSNAAMGQTKASDNCLCGACLPKSTALSDLSVATRYLNERQGYIASYLSSLNRDGMANTLRGASYFRTAVESRRLAEGYLRRLGEDVRNEGEVLITIRAALKDLEDRPIADNDSESGPKGMLQVDLAKLYENFNSANECLNWLASKVVTADKATPAQSSAAIAKFLSFAASIDLTPGYKNIEQSALGALNVLGGSTPSELNDITSTRELVTSALNNASVEKTRNMLAGGQIDLLLRYVGEVLSLYQSTQLKTFAAIRQSLETTRLMYKVALNDTSKGPELAGIYLSSRNGTKALYEPAHHYRSSRDQLAMYLNSPEVIADLGAVEKTVRAGLVSAGIAVVDQSGAKPSPKPRAQVTQLHDDFMTLLNQGVFQRRVFKNDCGDLKHSPCYIDMSTILGGLAGDPRQVESLFSDTSIAPSYYNIFNIITQSLVPKEDYEAFIVETKKSIEKSLKDSVQSILSEVNKKCHSSVVNIWTRNRLGSSSFYRNNGRQLTSHLQASCIGPSDLFADMFYGSPDAYTALKAGRRNFECNDLTDAVIGGALEEAGKRLRDTVETFLETKVRNEPDLEKAMQNYKVFMNEGLETALSAEVSGPLQSFLGSYFAELRETAGYVKLGVTTVMVLATVPFTMGGSALMLGVFTGSTSAATELVLVLVNDETDLDSAEKIMKTAAKGFAIGAVPVWGSRVITITSRWAQTFWFASAASNAAYRYVPNVLVDFGTVIGNGLVLGTATKMALNTIDGKPTFSGVTSALTTKTAILSLFYLPVMFGQRWSMQAVGLSKRDIDNLNSLAASRGVAVVVTRESNMRSVWDALKPAMNGFPASLNHHWYRSFMLLEMGWGKVATRVSLASLESQRALRTQKINEYVGFFNDKVLPKLTLFRNYSKIEATWPKLSARASLSAGIARLKAFNAEQRTQIDRMLEVAKNLKAAPYRFTRKVIKAVGRCADRAFAGKDSGASPQENYQLMRTAALEELRLRGFSTKPALVNVKNRDGFKAALRNRQPTELVVDGPTNALSQGPAYAGLSSMFEWLAIADGLEEDLGKGTFETALLYQALGDEELDALFASIATGAESKLGPWDRLFSQPVEKAEGFTHALAFPTLTLPGSVTDDLSVGEEIPALPMPF